MPPVQFNSYAGGPHGLGPAVMPMQKHPIGHIGEGLEALGNIPGQMQGMQLKQALQQLMLKALSTPTTVDQTVPGEVTKESVQGAPGAGTFQEYETGVEVPAMGDAFTQAPDRVVQSINPEYADIARKLEVLGYYRPYRGEGSKRYESAEEEATRAGLKEEAIQRAKAPERELTREELSQRREADRASREGIAAANRTAAGERAADRLDVDRERIAAQRSNAELADVTRTIMADAARRNAETNRLEAIARGDKRKADQIAALQTRLESVQNQIKTPPAVGGGAREWNYNDPKDQTTIRQYIQQENTLMDQLEQLGVNFPERRKLIEEEKNFIQSFTSRLFGAPTTRGKIQAVPRSGPPATPAPTGVNVRPPAPGTSSVTAPSNYPDSRTNIPSTNVPTNETVEQRRKRILGEVQ